MVSILPGARTSFDAVGDLLHKQISNNFPQGFQQGYQRQLGMNALSQAEQDIAGANGDPLKIAMAFAKAGAQNPNLERSLGPLASAAMANAKINNAFPKGQGMQNQNATSPNREIAANANAEMPSNNGQPQSQQQTSSFATPSPFNIMSADQINAEAQRYAQAVQDPNAFQTRQAQLQNQNTIATTQREALEDLAERSGVKPSDLNRFMQVGQKFDPSNPNEWAQKTTREFAKVKSNDDKIATAFIPEIGNALLGNDRKETLKRLVPTVQDQIKLGQEQETRKQLADNFVSQTEIEEMVHPLTAQKAKALENFPKGDFPALKGGSSQFLAMKGGGKAPERPKMSYEEMREKNPQKLLEQQNQLADFFLKNADKDTSLLVLRDKLWDEKDYDWRQIGPAIRQAEERGLKLEPFQSTEMTELETQAPRQSLPDIFQSLGRMMQYFRGNK